MLDNYLQITRQKNFPNKKNEDKIMITPSNNNNKIMISSNNIDKIKRIFRRPLQSEILKTLRNYKKLPNSNSPTSMRFVRKKNKYESFIRKISDVKERKLPVPMSPKEIERELMDRDERKLLDRLYIDQRIYRNELNSQLPSSIMFNLRSQKKKSFLN